MKFYVRTVFEKAKTIIHKVSFESYYGYVSAIYGLMVEVEGLLPGGASVGTRGLGGGGASVGTRGLGAGATVGTRAPGGGGGVERGGGSSKIFGRTWRLSIASATRAAMRTSSPSGNRPFKTE